jgi:hypothetical protein
MRRAIVLAGVATLALAACSHAKPPPDAAVNQFCADTGGLGEMLKTPGSPVAAARLADVDRRLTADVEALQQAGDAGVAAEAQLIQSLVASQMTGSALGAAPDPQLQHAASILADVRDKTC